MADIEDVTKLLNKMNVDGALDIAENVKDKTAISEHLTNYAAALGKHTGAFKEIEKILLKAVELDPKNAVAYYNLACLHTEPELLESDGDLVQKAVEEYEKAIEVDGKFVKARYNLALLLAYVGRAEDAWDHYDILLELDSKHSDKYDHLEGIIKGRLG